MSMQSVRVGIREFRENLAAYIESSTPVAITRHGETVGFYVPARRKREQADLEALRKAGEQLDAMIAAAGTTEDELVEDFKAARRNRVRKH
jgi:antitoxin (DNA-binding transcriptional repressor) of toxin-antitoxin stability system